MARAQQNVSDIKDPQREASEREASIDNLIKVPPGPKIHAAISAIMAEVGGVAKGRKNEQQGYKFRGIADIYLACQPLMAKYLVHVAPYQVLEESFYERETKSGSKQFHVRQRIEFRFYHADGSHVQCVTTGEAMDTGDKASNKVMSAAMKYALIMTFAIPEDDPDIDTENSSPEAHGPAGGRAPAAKQPPTRAAAPVDKAMAIGKLACSPAPEGLGWAKPHAVSWLKKYFGVDSTSALSPQQLSDAELLLLARKNSEPEYQRKLEMFHSEGRVLGAPEAA